jgi:hypothetical protein
VIQLPVMLAGAVHSAALRPGKQWCFCGFPPGLKPDMPVF